MSRRRLILVRHAHRDLQDRKLDNGLSEKGHAQARVLIDELSRRCGNQTPQLLSSPKLRCQETLTPFSEKIGKAFRVDQALSERDAKEEVSSFDSRVKRFLEVWTKSEDPLTIACSHGDWIPTATHHMIQLATEIGKSGLAEFEYSNSQWTLVDLIHSMKI